MDQLWGDKCVNRDHSELNKFQMRGKINCTASNLGRVIAFSLSLSLSPDSGAKGIEHPLI